MTPRRARRWRSTRCGSTALAGCAALHGRVGERPGDARRAAQTGAAASFAARFPAPDGGGLLRRGRRPRRATTPRAAQPAPRRTRCRTPRCAATRAAVARVARPRSAHPARACAALAPATPRYRGRHRGGPAERDRAYHQGTVWPWLIGPYVDAGRRAGLPTDGLLDGLGAHLPSGASARSARPPTATPPHGATGCPFQAWSVAELLRARRRRTGAARRRRPGRPRNSTPAPFSRPGGDHGAAPRQRAGVDSPPAGAPRGPDLRASRSVPPRRWSGRATANSCSLEYRNAQTLLPSVVATVIWIGCSTPWRRPVSSIRPTARATAPWWVVHQPEAEREEEEHPRSRSSPRCAGRTTG